MVRREKKSLSDIHPIMYNSPTYRSEYPLSSIDIYAVHLSPITLPQVKQRTGMIMGH